MVRRALCIVVLAASLPLASCATSPAPAEADRPGTHPAWLVGTWRGSAWQVAAANTQGHADVTLTVAADGAWKASTGASGTSRVVGDRVVLEGVASDGAKIRYTLKERQSPDGHEIWGVVQASFGAAAVSFKRVR